MVNEKSVASTLRAESRELLVRRRLPALVQTSAIKDEARGGFGARGTGAGESGFDGELRGKSNFAACWDAKQRYEARPSQVGVTFPLHAT